MDKFRPRKEIIHVQVGLDFGTSATKIIYAQVGGRFFRPVLFKHGLPNYPPFALPSVMAFGSHNNLLIGSDAARHLLDKPWQEGLQRLKMIVAGKYDPAFKEPQTEETFYRYLEIEKKDPGIFTPERLTAIFLAFALRQARYAVRRAPEFHNYDLDIAFNICMPIDHLENNLVRSAFENIFAWAEAIEVRWPQDDKAPDLLELSDITVNSAPYGHPESRVFAIPEAIAETASYRFSLEKTTGLHAVIDFGAGTTDVSIFNLRDEFHELTPYWYSARNIPWGMVNIERLLAETMIGYLRTGRIVSGNALAELLTSFKGDGTFALDQSIRTVMEDQVKAQFEELWGLPDYKIQAWGSAYGKLKKPSRWENVKVFVGGGGSQAPFVEQVFSIPWCYPTVQGPYTVNQLPEPNNYDSCGDQAPFHRMAVAYGLAFPKPILDGYVLPGDCPDHTPAPLPPAPIIDYDLQ
jgi:hypothetical protein